MGQGLGVVHLSIRPRGVGCLHPPGKFLLASFSTSKDFFGGFKGEGSGLGLGVGFAGPGLVARGGFGD